MPGGRTDMVLTSEVPDEPHVQAVPCEMGVVPREGRPLVPPSTLIHRPVHAYHETVIMF